MQLHNKTVAELVRTAPAPPITPPLITDDELATEERIVHRRRRSAGGKEDTADDAVVSVKAVAVSRRPLVIGPRKNERVS